MRALRADEAEGVIYLGSFSKTFSPGMRVGWASTSFSRTACGASAQPTRKPGRERLGERAEVDHALGLVGAQRAMRLLVEAEQAVGVVLEHQHVGLAADLEDLRAPLGGQGHAGGVVEVRDRVEELDPSCPAACTVRDRLRAAPRAPGRASSISTCTTSHW